MKKISDEDEKTIRDVAFQFLVYGQHLISCQTTLNVVGHCTCGFLEAQEDVKKVGDIFDVK